MYPNDGWRWLRPGLASGPLVGGNLGTLRSLAGTVYRPSFIGAILFWEEVKLESAPVHAIDEALTHLGLLGVFDPLAGMVVGKIWGLSDAEHRQVDDLLLRHTASWDFPILTFGHTDPRLILPLGVRAALDAGADRFALEEAAVR